MDSFKNFIWDLFIKSFECKDALIESTDHLSDSDRMSIAFERLGNIDVWKRIYQDRKRSLEKNVLLTRQDQIIPVDRVEFHSRFGWTLSGVVAKAYLGKSSIFRNVHIEIGHRTYFSGHSNLLGSGTFKIGSYCAVAENLYANVQPDFHPFNYPSLFNFATETRMREDGLTIPLKFNADFDNAAHGITIGNDVWVARNVRLSHGVEIGNGCVIAEGSLVRENCEPYGIYAGTPAKLIRYRFKKRTIEELQKIAWWDWTETRILRNKAFFDSDLTVYKGHVKDLVQAET